MVYSQGMREEQRTDEQLNPSLPGALYARTSPLTHFHTALNTDAKYPQSLSEGSLHSIPVDCGQF